jgi:hypothetical protein
MKLVERQAVNHLNAQTKLAAGTPATRLALAGYVESDGSHHVNYVDANGHVHELYLSPS